MGEQKSVLTLVSAPDGTLTGNNSGAVGSVEISNGKVDGNKISFGMKVSVPFPITLDCEASVEGDAMTGSMKAGAFGSFPMHGTRQA
jgi:hypothetical protein